MTSIASTSQSQNMSNASDTRSKTGTCLVVRKSIHAHTFDYKIIRTDVNVVVRVDTRGMAHKIFMTLRNEGIIAQYKKGKQSAAWFLNVIL